MSRPRILCLGAGDGWHADQLARAADRLQCELKFATYESMQASIDNDHGCRLQCEAGDMGDFDAVLTRTMPAGSLEQITFRLAMLHALDQPASVGESASPAIVNRPRSLEIAIDKFATLQQVGRLGYAVPDTTVVQSRSEAIDAFHRLGGDCIVKPIFGGEGRGVMRISDPELAWTSFSTLEQLDAVLYVQKFVPPGGADMRLLVIGDRVIGIRRTNATDFRTNRLHGGSSESFDPSDDQAALAARICATLQLHFASVDLIQCDDGPPRVIEVNAIPGWKAAQTVTQVPIADWIVQLLIDSASPAVEASC